MKNAYNTSAYGSFAYVYDIFMDIMQEKKVHLLDEDELMAAKGAFRLAELYYKWKEGE